MLELKNVKISRLDSYSFTDKETGEVTKKTKVTYLTPLETTDRVAGYHERSSYSNKSIKELLPLLDKNLTAYIEEFPTDKGSNFRLKKIGSTSL